MLDESQLIGLLKWAAFAVALASTLWGVLAPKPNREEVDGHKRLTRSGAITLGLVIGGASISGLSLWLENALKRKSDAEAQAKAAEQARLQRAIADSTIVTEANTRRGLAELEAARAEGRAEAARAQSDAWARETRQVLRDVRLAQQVVRGAERNLQRTGQALTQIERVLQPLEAITLTVVWEIPGTAPQMPEITAKLAAHARVVRAEWLEAYNAAYRAKPPKPEIISLPPGDEHYPNGNREANFLFGHLIHARIYMAFAAQGRPPDKLLNVPGQTHFELSGADLLLSIPPVPNPKLDYVIDTGAIRFTAEASFATQAMRPTGTIVSYPDLERSTAIIWVDYRGMLFPPSYPVAVRLRTPSRLYTASREQMRPVPKYWPVFVLPPLTPKQPE